MERLMIDMVDRWNELGDNEKVVIVLDRVGRDKARYKEQSLQSYLTWFYLWE